MKNPINSLQDYCNNNGVTVTFSPGATILMEGKGGENALTLSCAALARQVGVPAANDNAPADMAAPGYERLADVLRRAFDQASNGKGHERHGNALPFHKQPMQSIAAQVGPGFLTGQAIKKIQESQILLPGRDVAELLGAMNYIAGVVIYLEDKRAANDAAAHG